MAFDEPSVFFKKQVAPSALYNAAIAKTTSPDKRCSALDVHNLVNLVTDSIFPYDIQWSYIPAFMRHRNHIHIPFVKTHHLHLLLNTTQIIESEVAYFNYSCNK